MQTTKRIYPSERKPSKWMSYLLLFLSLVIILSGLFTKGREVPSIEPIAEVTPEPFTDSFDETRATREITLKEQQWYALQLGAFENEDSAREQAALFQKRGAAGYLWQDSRFRVLAAVYPLRDDAQRVRDQLQENHAVDSYLFEIALPALMLRLTGMNGQLDILEAAFIHADDTIAALQSLSVTLDRQEISNEEAAEQLRIRMQQLDQVSTRLSQRFAQPRNNAVNQLIAFFDDYGEFVNGLSSDLTNAGLSVAVKYQTLRSLWLMVQLRDTL